ncbi:tetratricopeptide repeat protein [Acinetobacter sp. R933-2]|uniref:tetratricopeptide repeat protein n=1 Tax=Acinetobacter sp. R933-2 TaxID=2746728 RepID=UPI0025771D26|nr:tetratricopeptide repeat protein [Acinetobacter sp. R933-2]MDM1247848.1 tetratricopeptide repeat protein [Acinetobacter sp. R933-2]
MQIKFLGILTLFLGLAACQSTPIQSGSGKKPEPPVTQKPHVETPDGVKIIPYERPEIKREPMQVIVPEQKANVQKFDDGRNIPAFNQLIQKTQTAFRQTKWDEAEKYALQAQRLAPQSAETYLWLAMIANHKKQARNADALARRGLSFAQSNAMRKQLWNTILQAAQQQRDSKTIAEAQAQLKGL